MILNTSSILTDHSVKLLKYLKVKSDEIDTVKANLAKLQTFPEGDEAKTVEEWATYVEAEWNGLGEKINEQNDIIKAKEGMLACASLNQCNIYRLY